MRRIYSWCVSAAILYSTAWDGEAAAIFAIAEVVEGEQSVAYVAPEDEHVKIAQREEADVAVHGSEEEKLDTPEEDNAEREEESANAADVSGTVLDSERNEGLIPEADTKNPATVVTAATEEADEESRETAETTVTSFAHMRERARGRVNNPRRPTPSLSRPPQQADSASKVSSRRGAKPVKAPAATPRDTDDTTFTRLLNLILSLSGVDIHDPKHVHLTRDVNHLVTDVLMRTSNVDDDPNAHEMEQEAAFLGDAADLVKRVQPFPFLPNLISFSWIQAIFEVLKLSVRVIQELVQESRLKDAHYLMNDTDIFDLMKFMDRLLYVFPSEISKALIVFRDYENLLQQVLSQAENAEEFAASTDGDATSVATALSIIQERVALMNQLSSFETYALTSYSDRIHAMDAAQAEIPDAASDKKRSNIFGEDMSKVPTSLPDPMDIVEKLKAVMFSISEMCAASDKESEVPEFCKSMARAVGAEDNVEDVPRKLQEYLGDEDSILSRVVESFPMELQPQVDTVLARVPQLFPILAAATTNAVSAFVESSQEVVNWASSTAQEVLPIVRNSEFLPQVPQTAQN